MRCEYCYGINGNHDSRCPNYEPPSSNCTCLKCGEKILIGEEYIVNDNEDYVHFDCVDSRYLAIFLGYDVKEMECDNKK